jgi:hypothetical protein
VTLASSADYGILTTIALFQEATMRLISLLVLLLLIMSSALPAEARRRAASPPPAVAGSDEQAVLRDLEQILDLWRDGRYDDLYNRTVLGKHGREQFAKKLASAPRHPACCWEKIQDARVALSGDRSAVVRARLGFEGSVPGTEFVTKGIKLKREDGVWMISQADLYSLADLSSRKRRYKYLPIQPK